MEVSILLLILGISILVCWGSQTLLEASGKSIPKVVTILFHLVYFVSLIIAYQVF